MVNIYTDTNALRYLCAAFSDSNLALGLKNKLVLSPVTIMELVSQLGTSGAEEAFAAIQALPNVQNSENTLMLPWRDDFFRMSIFNLPPGEDTVTPALRNAVVNVLNASSAHELADDGREVRASLDEAKSQSAKEFSDLLESWRSVGPLAEDEHKAIFARSIARQAHVDDTMIDVDHVAKSLDAFYTFEKCRMHVGSRHHDYNVSKHSNDIWDAELLIYLADPTLHLLTSDKGFRRIEGSAQASRVHIVDATRLRNPEYASEELRMIVEITDR